MDLNPQAKLINIFNESFEIENIEEIKNLSTENCLTWDSLATVSLIASISSEFSIVISPDEFEMFTSYKNIEKILKRKGIKII
tara:strand:- start:124 stop:372 length:249 start_codon:yes stop_codon:yes gene_type:complete